ncbi:MAG: flagellar basal body rod C-terminal domain-containing protein [Planctomycetota bacterium]|jgi:flagellar hook protein FlgE
MIKAKRGVQANANTVKVADEMTGSLIDILA